MRSAPLLGSCGLPILSERYRFARSLAGLEHAAHLARNAVYQLERRVGCGVDRLDGGRKRTGDIVDILKDLIDAHDLEIRSVDRERNALDERIDLGHDGFKRFGYLFDVGERGLDLALHVIDGFTCFPDRHNEFDDKPHEGGTHQDVYDRKRDLYYFSEIH